MAWDSSQKTMIVPNNSMTVINIGISEIIIFNDKYRL